MCVAVVVESKKRIPADYLRAMAEHNPDGGGVAWIDGDHLQYRKGLDWQEIDAIQDKLPRPFFMHFRIATRGAKIPELTHPFPLGMQAFSDDLVGFADSVLIHNGTWGDYRPHVPNGIDPNKVSDTQVAAFVAETNEDILKDVKWSNAVMHARGNGKADITMRGNWQEFEGNYYSNFHWRTEVYDWRDFQDWRGRHIANSNLVGRKKGASHQQNRNQENGRKRADTQPMVQALGGKDYCRECFTYGLFTRDGACGACGCFPSKNARGGTVRPVEGYYEGMYSDAFNTGEYSSAMGGQYSQLKGTNEFKGPETSYERAVARYQESLDRQPKTGEYDYGSESRASKGWDGEPLFTPEALRKASKPITCNDCKQEVKTIPCQCTYENKEDDEVEISIEDLTPEEREALGIELEDLSSDGVPHPVDNDYSSGPVDMNDVEDMNAEGHTYADLEDLEEPSNNLVLAGDTAEDWRKVDEWIRVQGIKI